MIDILPTDQLEKVLNQKCCDIDYSFMGFTDVYELLSRIIPLHFTIVDLGCGYNPQCFYFKNHKKYIAVDCFPNLIRFCSENCNIYEMKISEFISKHLNEFYLPETFAICSYVPPWYDDNIKLVRENFLNVFTYYPHGCDINIMIPKSEHPDKEVFKNNRGKK